MEWGEVGKMRYMRGLKSDWLERRMNIRKRGAEPVPIPQTSSGGNGNVWFWLIGAFVLLKIIQALANS